MNCTPLHRLAIALSTVAVVVSIAIDDGRAAKVRKNTVQAELPPGELVDHAVGDKAVWMYKKQGGKKLTVVVTGVKGGIVSWQRTDGCSYDISRVIWRPPTKWKNCYGGTGTAKVARKGKSRLYPLKVGNTEKFSVQGKYKRDGKGGKFSTTRVCKVKSTANVTVPAGRFDTYRIDCSDEWTLYRWYYSPELRLPVLFRQAPRKGKTGRHAYQELVSFEPAKASGGTAQGERKTSSAAVASKRRIKTEQEFRADAEAGDATAQFTLGNWYQRGTGVEIDLGAAVLWYTRAAEQGHADAQNSLGLMYDHGTGVPEDDAKAVEWFTRAAKQGNLPSLQNFGNMYWYGRGVAEDRKEAVRLYTKAAKGGLSFAQYTIGSLYRDGKGVRKSLGKARRWFKKAVKQGHPRAQNDLGVFYAMGLGVRVDLAKARRLFTDAAEQGHPHAQNNLGILYENGLGGVSKDRAKAIEWYTKAADQGHAEAITRLEALKGSGG